ncbi:hypothetical protein [Streptomyces sp. G-G2]|uniref:hypothetical protein n=1 Tax=Streptomyces sp. G-G2 TaxID=3046201 RepID=UPI0024B9D1CF|nr:hypothetical protein [Streptomyces sp. G-G2]MDJ0384070.1 hypothetical protein [Streptomyces sp. G-G2]
MSTTLPTAVATAPPSVPRWVDRAAHAVPLVVLPSGLWRMAMAVGIPVGFSGQLAADWRPGWETSSYITLLTLFTEALALLTLGLVRPWGEKVPRWVPLLADRRVPPWAAAAPALLGALAVTAVTLLMFRGGWPASAGGPEGPEGGAAWIMNACYVPMLLWGPLLATVAIAYALRRRNT